MNTIRWGIIGCGDVTEVKSGPGFQKAEGSELIAVMRRNGEKARDYARRHNVPKWYDDAGKLIGDPEVDAVYVATPPGSHLEYALMVCDAGKPCYVEKPMARNHEECLSMQDYFQKKRVPLFIAYYRRSLLRFVRTKELIESGVLGRIISVIYRFSDSLHAGVDPQNPPWRLKPAESGGGFFMDLGCHVLDILDFIFGPLKEITGMAMNAGSPSSVEDTVVMHFRFPSSSAGAAIWNFAGDNHEDVIEISGSDAKITLPVFDNLPLRLDSKGKTEILDLPNPTNIQQPYIQSIVNELRGKEVCPGKVESAVRTSWIMDEVLKSYYGSRASGFWDNPASWCGNRFSGRERNC